MGMEKSPNIMKPTNGMSCAMVLESVKVSLARPTNGPTASPNPMQRNARKIGKVLDFMEFPPLVPNKRAGNIIQKPTNNQGKIDESLQRRLHNRPYEDEPRILPTIGKLQSETRILAPGATAKPVSPS